MVEVIGNINEVIINLEINSVNYTYTSLSNDDKIKVDKFISFLSPILNNERYLSIYGINEVIKLTFNGSSIDSDYHELLDFNFLSDVEKFTINEIINL